MINDITVAADKEFDDFVQGVPAYTKATEAERDLARVFFRAGFLRGTVSLAKSIKEMTSERSEPRTAVE